MQYLVSFLCCLVLSTAAQAQLSPGELAKAHAGLEGLSNCTQCHQLGQHIDGQKCLDCHSEIQVRVEAQRGFHATVRDSNCVACHSDHNGKAFEMIRWPNEEMTQFDHASTGYVLRGEKHQKAACRDCHQKKNIQADDILAKKEGLLDHTFLGLDQNCSSCHADIHKGQFAQSCDACHGVDHWKPPENFSHDQARFALVGKHASVACEKCHLDEGEKESLPGAFTRFRPVAFDACASCHEDIHKGQFAGTCEGCHSPNGWFETHLESFNHNQTRYPLVGKHSGVKCQLCHGNKSKLTRPAFEACSDCHKDVHIGQFANRSDGGRCDACHSETGFTPTKFDLQMHQDSRFPLKEAHQAVPCMMCHQKSETQVMQFVWTQDALMCRDCHQSTHGAQFTDRIAKEGCESCHNASTWRHVDIDHSLTQFPLLGKHKKATCEQCHKVVETNEFSGRVYESLSGACQDCHTDQHDGQFVRSGITACARCHTSEDWKAVLFNHNRDALFSLTGAHEDVACEKCHTPVVLANGKKDRLYKPLEMACSACHGEM